MSALIYISKRDTRAQRELSECLKINDSYIEALIMLGEITSETNPTESVKYFEKALYIDKNCASAYYGLAVISEKAGDFECALDYYNEYAAIKSTDEIQSEIIAKIAIFSFLCNKSNWELSFQKLNKFFKKQEQISGNVLVIIPIMGSNKHYIFLLHSKEDGFSVTYDDKIIFEYELNTNSRSSIGVSLPNIDFSRRKGMYKLEFINQDSFNPARLSDRAIMEETALPTIIRECSNLEGYEDTLSKLLATDKLRFNHKFKNDDEEYIISDEDITIKMEVTGSELIGNIRIQNILIKIWIPNIGEGFQAFKKQLSRDCFSNDACIIIKYKDFNTILRFNKKVINIKYYD